MPMQNVRQHRARSGLKDLSTAVTKAEDFPLEMWYLAQQGKDYVPFLWLPNPDSSRYTMQLPFIFSV